MRLLLALCAAAVLMAGCAKKEAEQAPPPADSTMPSTTTEPSATPPPEETPPAAETPPPAESTPPPAQ
jgi:hypothetical protein